MKERPILFSGPMVSAIFDNQKTQTRRVVKPQPLVDLAAIFRVDRGDWNILDAFGDATVLPCPYGQPGDLLVPLTTWRAGEWYDNLKPTELPADCAFWSWWDGGPSEIPVLGKRRPGRFMPKILRHNLPRLPVTGVRVERLQEISVDDILAEGVRIDLNSGSKGEAEYPADFDRWTEDGKTRWAEAVARATYIARCDNTERAVAEFGKLWDSINAKRGFGWDVNPWVWVISFERIDGP